VPITKNMLLSVRLKVCRADRRFFDPSRRLTVDVRRHSAA
jgi:hypothetical protein